MKCTNPFKVEGEAGKFDFRAPCGQCQYCKKQRAAEWSFRLQHENLYWSCATFLTLTYSDENLPPNKSVNGDDVTLFIKRLRKQCQDRKIKYFLSAEYSPTKQRPHYHAIIFGLHFFHDRHLMQKSWGLGRINSKQITPARIRYVANYVQKKLYGQVKDWVYTKTARETPFQRQSQGIGERYIMENMKNIIINGSTQNGKTVATPRYYKKKLTRRWMVEKRS